MRLLRRRTARPLDVLAGRALPLVRDLRVHAIDSPDFTAGAEAMRAAVLDVLNEAAATSCRCHPAYHELGVHAPGLTAGAAR
jgi:hypothetical protein